MFKKIKSFSLIEVIVSIMILSLVVLSVLSLFNKFFKDETQYNQDFKFEKISLQIKKIIEYKYLNFIISKNILDLNTTKIGGSKPYNDTINKAVILYENEILLPMFDETNLTKMDLQLKFWELSKKQLEEYPNKPYDIFVTQNINSYKNILYPYKNVFIFKWNNLYKMRDFNDSVKNCLFSINTNKEISFVDYNDLSNIDVIDNSVVTPCNVIINNFITNNNKALESKIDTNNLESSYQSIKNEFKFLKIDNLNIMKNKMDLTMEKFDKVVSNLHDFSVREHKLVGMNYETTINHFVSCYFDDVNTHANQCTITNYNNGEKLNINKIKFLFSNGIWMEDNSTGTPQTLHNSDMNTTDVKNSLMTFRVDSLGHKKPLAPARMTGTTAPNLENIRELEYFNDINITGMVSVKMPSLSLGFNPINRLTSKEGEIVFVPEAYRIFGLYDEIGSSKLGVSEFMDLPFYFTNISGSMLKINKQANVISPEVFDTNLTFDLNVPIIKNKNTAYEEENSGPYSAGLLVIFPWIVDSNETLIHDYNYGYYFKTITSIR